MSTDQQQPEAESQVLDVVRESAISLIAKAEIDTQIATAQAFPRSLSRVIKVAISMATINEEVAQSCTYSVPRAGKQIQGKSIRLAEIMASTYGNLRTGSRVIHMDGRVLKAQGICHDLETNYLHTEEIEVRVTDKQGRTYNHDMLVIAGRSACAIAVRNAIFTVVPGAVADIVWNAAQKIALGTLETLPARRLKAMTYFEGLGIKKEQVFATLGVNGLEDIDLEKLGTLTGYKSAFSHGEATLADLFPPPTAKDKADKATRSTEDKLNKKDASKKVEKDLAASKQA